MGNKAHFCTYLDDGVRRDVLVLTMDLVDAVLRSRVEDGEPRVNLLLDVDDRLGVDDRGPEDVGLVVVAVVERLLEHGRRGLVDVRTPDGDACLGVRLLHVLSVVRVDVRVRLDDGRLEEVLLLHHGRRSWVRAYDHLHIFFFFFSSPTCIVVPHS